MTTSTNMALVHGWAFGPSVWQELLPDLSPAWKTACWHLPGYGGWGDDPMLDPDGLGDGEPMVAVGWSLGGMLLAAMAARSPERLRALVLVSVNARFLADDGWPDAVDPAEFDALESGLHHDREATLRRFAGLCARGGASRPTLRALLHCLETQPPTATGVLCDGLSRLKSMDLRPALAALRIPVRLIVGDADPLVPVAAVAAMQGINPRLQVCVIPGAGHAPFLSHRAAFLGALEPMAA